MWNNVNLELVEQRNFNYSFPGYFSDVILQLSQWQYWWWFWFSFLWVFYNFFFLRLIRFRTHKNHPKLNTSLRGHGKWGDFLAAILPVSWCLNILINSNFILRAIEWQHENCLFTIRIHGKQWYWVYKYDIKDFVNVKNVYYNVGFNNWVKFNNSNLFNKYDKLNVFINFKKNKWIDNYELNIVNRLLTTNKKYNLNYLNNINNIGESSENYDKIENSDNNDSNSKDNIIDNNNNNKILRYDVFNPYPDNYNRWEEYYVGNDVYERWRSTPYNDFIRLVISKNFDFSHIPLNKDNRFYKYNNLSSEIKILDFEIFKNYFSKYSKKYEDLLKSYESDEIYKDNDMDAEELFFLLSCENDDLPESLYMSICDRNFLGGKLRLNYKFFNRKVNSYDIDSKMYTQFSNYKIYKFKKFKLSPAYRRSIYNFDHLNIQLKKLLNKQTNLNSNIKLYNYDTIDNEWDVTYNIKLRDDIKNIFRFNKIRVRSNKININDETSNYFNNITINKLLDKDNFFDYLKIIDNYKKLHNIDFKLFKFNYFKNKNILEHKPIPNNFYYTIKQKRYDRKLEVKQQSDNAYTYTYKNRIIEEKNNSFKKYNISNLYKKNSEMIPITLSKRLLRTKYVLILPTFFNIALVTNSYDVAHSWYIPGLALKFDCVPGRSTHHTLFIDHPGFYYGQCAEVCGRYHHHMPIRICALPYEHFILWWKNFVIAKYFNIGEQKNNYLNLNYTIYKW